MAIIAKDVAQVAVEMERLTIFVITWALLQDTGLVTVDTKRCWVTL
jgi:hypothetical protein